MAYNQSLASNANEKNKPQAANSYLNIGVIYNDQKNYKGALRYEKIGLKLYTETGEKADYYFNKEIQIAIALEGLEAVYIFTDGYAGQFGGPQGKKYKHSRLKELSFFAHLQEPKQQEKELAEAFEKWKGNLDRVDDVLVAGIKFGKNS